MCLAVPGRIMSIAERDDPLMAQVAFGAGCRDSLADLWTLGVNEFTHFGDQRGLFLCSEEDFFTH